MIPSRIAIAIPALSFSVLLCTCATNGASRQAQNLDARPFNQLLLSGNACGPTALLNSYRYAKPSWRKLAENPPHLSDRDRIRAIVSGPAMRPSVSLPGRARWSRNGVNLTDLRDIANEISKTEMLPALSQETLFLKPGESQQKFLRRVHSRLVQSLAEGFPPILSIRRFVKRGSTWSAIQGHFVTITSVATLPSNATSFDLNYVDPLGGKFSSGKIAITPEAFLTSDPARNPNLEALFPSSRIGKSSLRSGDKSILAVSATLGRF
ncbi:MAG: hypothetical protein H7Y36_00750 [Armatimonadetes bacterium]|nr:hypothetical protein [Akkermansiaceae bacterium]